MTIITVINNSFTCFVKEKEICLSSLVNESRLDLRFMRNLEWFAKAQTHRYNVERDVRLRHARWN